MASINRVFVMGRLGQDPELRYTGNQTPVVTLNIATTENWTRDGQKQEQTEWHRVIVWSKQAENCAKYLSKGRSVFVEGKLQTRSWDDKSGQKRYTTEIVASNVQFMPAGPGQSPSHPQEEHGMNSGSYGNDYPSMKDQGSMGAAGLGDLDEIPF